MDYSMDHHAFSRRTRANKYIEAADLRRFVVASAIICLGISASPPRAAVAAPTDCGDVWELAHWWGPGLLVWHYDHKDNDEIPVEDEANEWEVFPEHWEDQTNPHSSLRHWEQGYEHVIGEEQAHLWCGPGGG